MSTEGIPTYIVIKYFNCRKNISFEILSIFCSLSDAYDNALECAKKEYNDEMTISVEEKCVNVHNVLVEFTHRDGYGKHVYGIVMFYQNKDDIQR